MSATGVRRLELAALAVVIVLALLLHIGAWRAAGPLWRDEINSVRLASSPSITQFTRDLQFDSFPALWFGVLRAWLAITHSLRLLGLLTGVAVLLAAWLAARALGARAPVIALALIGTSAAVIRYGDSIRAYGLAMFFALLTVAAFFRAASRPTRGAHAVAALIAIAGVHVSYYNALTLFACGVVAALLLARRGRWGESWKPLAIGAVAAVSLLIYLPVIRLVRQWSIAQYEVDALWIWHKLDETFALSGTLSTRFWLALLFIAPVVAVATMFRDDLASLDEKRNDGAFFALMLFLILTTVYFIFLMSLSYLMQPWYFVVWLAVAAVSIDAMLSTLEHQTSGTIARVATALLLAILAFRPAKTFVTERATSMDRVGATAASMSRPGDLIVVYPWYCGVSFSHHYRGQVAWTTLPPLPDHRLHRYDLARTASLDAKSAADVAARAQQTLARGNTVWLAGLPLFEESGAYLQHPERATGIAAADLRWSAALANVLRGRSARMAVPPDPRVSQYERVALVAFR